MHAYYTAEQMRAYAEAAVKAEREACARVCEKLAEDHRDAYIRGSGVQPAHGWTIRWRLQGCRCYPYKGGVDDRESSDDHIRGAPKGRRER